MYPVVKKQKFKQLHYAYFSNFIKGTEFAFNEAKEIISTNTPLPTRYADSHDILVYKQIIALTAMVWRVCLLMMNDEHHFTCEAWVLCGGLLFTIGHYLSGIQFR